MSQPSNKPDRGSSPSMPRWVKVFGIIFVVIVLLLIVSHLLGFGFDGHFSSADYWM